MTDTPESVRKAVQDYVGYVATHHGVGVELLAIGRNYADLLERIEKAPVVLLFDNGQIMGPMGKWKLADVEKLGGKRVALLQVED